MNCPLPSVLLRLGRPDYDAAGYLALQQRHGEGAVDIRSSQAVETAMEENRVIVLEAEGRIVGTASYFDRGHSIEMGGLTLDPQIRRRGLAQLLAMCRIIMILPGYDNLPILSEVYASSIKSLRYLSRIGFQPLDRVPSAFHYVAWQANATQAVIYMVADPMYYQSLCFKFEAIARAGSVCGSDGSVNVTISDEFDGHLMLLHSAQKAEYADEAFSNRDFVGGGRNLSRWLTRHCGAECITRSEFMRYNSLEPSSWGYPEPELDTLARQFIHSIQNAATS